MIMIRIRHTMLVLFIVVCTTIPTVLAAQQVTRIDTIVPFSRTGVVKLELRSGDIRVTTWDSNTVRVVARGNTLKFDISKRPLSLTLRSGSSAKYEVTLPVGTRLELSATSGDIVVAGNPGDVQAQTASGDIVVRGGGHVSLETVSGDIQVSGTTGDVKVWSVSGSVRVEKATGAIESETVSGDMRIVDARARRMHLSSTSGSISYTGMLNPEGHYKLESHSGDVTLSLPKDVRTSLDITTFSGKVVNEFGNAVRLSVESAAKKPRHHHQYTIGKPGGGRVSITTFSGDIDIEED